MVRETEYSKVINLGKVAYETPGRRDNLVEIELELRDHPADTLVGSTLELSICGNIWNREHTDVVSCGQNHDTIAELFPRNAKVQRLVEIWRTWHLNGMKAGCRHQRELGWDKEPIDPSKPTNTYGRHFEGQKQDSWNLTGWIRESEHSRGKLSKPCPVCGYRFGSAWRTEELPHEVVTELKTLVESLGGVDQ